MCELPNVEIHEFIKVTHMHGAFVTLEFAAHHIAFQNNAKYYFDRKNSCFFYDKIFLSLRIILSK